MFSKLSARICCVSAASVAALVLLASWSSPARAEVIAQGVRGSTVEGSAFRGAVAYFVCTRPGAAATDFLADITWADGSTSSGTIAADSVRGFYVQGEHVYANAGIYHLQIRIEDVVDGYVTTKLRIGVQLR
jgi:hypothetical protein